MGDYQKRLSKDNTDNSEEKEMKKIWSIIRNLFDSQLNKMCWETNQK